MDALADVPAAAASGRPAIVRDLGRQPYEPVWRAMQAFTDARDDATQDELWLVEHDPVFTLGQAGKPEHVLMPGEIPVLHVDRGGQVTYHGPGQLVIYLLLDIKRAGVGARALVSLIENSIIAVLARYGIAAEARADAPGVYVDGRKIASLGLKVRNGCTYHGLSLNVDMDLAPFAGINPCGLRGMEMTQLRDLGVEASMSEVASRLSAELQKQWQEKIAENKLK